MHLTWNGHSCFTLETQQGKLVLDPYRPGSVPGLPDLKLEADGVYCSHQHDDHAGAELVTLSGRGHTVQVEEIETYHDPEQGALRGKNTIRIFIAEGLRVAHLGDLGCELTAEQIQRLAGLDALLFPVGGFYTIDAQQARKVVEQLKPRVAVPMHYRGENFGYDVIGPLEDYLALCSDVVRYPSNTLESEARRRDEFFCHAAAILVCQMFQQNIPVVGENSLRHLIQQAVESAADGRAGQSRHHSVPAVHCQIF